MTVAQLFARIGLHADTDKAEQFSKSVKGIVGQLKVATVGAVAFGAAVVTAMHGALESAAAFRQFQAETGASSDELQKWQAIAAGTNVSTQAIADSVKNLAQNREKIKLGQGNFSGFAFLGINPMDDPFKILDELRTKTQGLPQAMKANLLQQMGVSEQYLQILSLTNDQFNEMKANAFVIPQSALKSLNDTQGSLNTLGNAIKWFQALLSEQLAPIINRVVRGITEWIRQNKDGLIAGIVKGTQIIVGFFTALINVATWIGKIVSSTIGWKNALYVMLIAWGYFNRALLASPIGAIIAGILLLILVLDDLHAALGIDGDKRESFFGKIFAKNPELKKMFEGLAEAAKILSILMGEMFQGKLESLDEAIKKWGVLGGILWGFVEVLKVAGRLIALNFEGFGRTFDIIGKLGKGDFSGAFKSGSEYFAKFGDLVNDVTKDITGKDLTTIFGIKPDNAPAAPVIPAPNVSVQVTNSSDSPIKSAVDVKRDKEAVGIQANRPKVSGQ